MGNIQFPLLTHKLLCARQAELHPPGQGNPEVQQPSKHLSPQHGVSGWAHCKDQAPGISSSEEKLFFLLAY